MLLDAFGLVTRRQVFWTRDEALEAAGLRESVFGCSPAAHCRAIGDNVVPLRRAVGE